jgi:hypothetical protein
LLASLEALQWRLSWIYSVIEGKSVYASWEFPVTGIEAKKSYLVPTAHSPRSFNQVAVLVAHGDPYDGDGVAFRNYINYIT